MFDLWRVEGVANIMAIRCCGGEAVKVRLEYEGKFHRRQLVMVIHGRWREEREME